MSNKPFINMSKFILLSDIGMAYRKAKVDLFYSQRACRNELRIFEEDLINNLKAIRNLLIKQIMPVISEDSWTLVPKSIKDSIPESDVISSDPQHPWEVMCCKAIDEKRKVNLEYRLMENLPIDFHVIAALWINKVGHKFEEKLKDSARGNRLRRGKSGTINLFSLGSRVSYLHAYSKWRDDAFISMQNALEHKKAVVTITADVSSFYHKIDVQFMLDEDFINRIGVVLDENEKVLHQLFIKTLVNWAKNTPLKFGLPVGLASSSVIANLALFELDKLMEEKITPLYYGRYVDDIILVMENGSNFKKSADVWDWLIDRLNGVLFWDKNKKEIVYHQSYLKKSKIVFTNEKNKTFLLSGEIGSSILNSIRRIVQSRTSEWRSLPNLPNTPVQLESSLLSAIQRDGISADSLRKSDRISVQRAGFAIILRDIEAYNRALIPDAWKEIRHSFFRSFIRHIEVLPTFFDFFVYLPRLLSLAINCADFNYFRLMLDALNDILYKLESCNNSIKAIEDKGEQNSTEILSRFEINLKAIILEAVESSFPLSLSKKSKLLWQTLFSENHRLYGSKSLEEISSINKKYLKKDLAFNPLKRYLLPEALSERRYNPKSRKYLSNISINTVSTLLYNKVIDGCIVVANLSKLPKSEKLPTGLLFPVRPLSIHDLYLLHPEPFSEKGIEDISCALLALRGFKPEKGLSFQGGKNLSSIEINYERGYYKTIRIGVTSWKTSKKSWLASASKNTDPDKTRMERLNNLLNQVLQCRNHPDYLILPELSIPSHWFLAIAIKLQTKKISLICGIEYIHKKGKIVHNQVWSAFSNDSLGFPAMIIYRQDKQRPALHEEEELYKISGVELKPQLKPWISPPIIKHGGFQFSILICSELTNIAYRTALRGKVDALFIPEWNKDTESFNAIVESSALDVHAYIIQCNDRQYGDSRIRAPFKENWKRDIIRIKGGIEDYFVCGEINIKSLRAFQSSFRSFDTTFKPVPDGFEIALDRKEQPTGDSSND